MSGNTKNVNESFFIQNNPNTETQVWVPVMESDNPYTSKDIVRASVFTKIPKDNTASIEEMVTEAKRRIKNHYPNVSTNNIIINIVQSKK